MIPYYLTDASYRAFKKALDMARQNHVKITLVKTISYTEGMGLDMSVVTNAASSEYNIREFGKNTSQSPKRGNTCQSRLTF